MSQQQALTEQLLRLGVAPIARIPIEQDHWPRVETAIRVRPRDPARRRRPVLHEAVWRERAAAVPAESWVLRPEHVATVARQKKALRETPTNEVVALEDGGTAYLHAFHVPDEDAAWDARRIEAALRLARGDTGAIRAARCG